jgi:hypothetical protein
MIGRIGEAVSTRPSEDSHGDTQDFARNLYEEEAFSVVFKSCVSSSIDMHMH